MLFYSCVMMMLLDDKHYCHLNLGEFSIKWGPQLGGPGCFSVLYQ